MGAQEILAQISVDLDSAARRCRAGATREEIALAVEKIASDFGTILDLDLTQTQTMTKASELETEANAGNHSSRVNLNQTPTVPKNRGRPRRPGSPVTADFAAFWQGYPRKVGKGAALRAWATAAIAEAGEDLLLRKCLAALKWQRYSRDWKKDDGVFIPHPATYLNGQRYLDEPTEPQRGSEEPPPAQRPPPPQVDLAQREAQRGKVGNVLREFTKALAAPPPEQDEANEEATRRKLAEQAKQMGVR